MKKSPCPRCEKKSYRNFFLTFRRFWVKDTPVTQILFLVRKALYPSLSHRALPRIAKPLFRTVASHILIVTRFARGLGTAVDGLPFFMETSCVRGLRVPYVHTNVPYQSRHRSFTVSKHHFDPEHKHFLCYILMHRRSFMYSGQSRARLVNKLGERNFAAGPYPPSSPYTSGSSLPYVSVDAVRVRALRSVRTYPARITHHFCMYLTCVLLSKG